MAESMNLFKLLSNGSNYESVAQSYIQPPEKRPGNLALPVYQNAPIINLGGGDGFDRANTIHQIFKAIEEFGFFQLVNHGISEELMEEVMGVSKEFFELPVEDRLNLYSEDPSQPVSVSSSISPGKEDVHYWRDKLRHVCHPVEDSIHLWPSKPTKYREVVAKYSVKARVLCLKLLELFSEGLGLQSNYFDGELSQTQSMLVNHYPPCPDPSLTLGLPKHKDPNIITLLLQGDVFGLQVYKNGEWFDVEPLPHAYVVILGHQLQVISNDKLRGVEHRVLTNSSTARTTITTQIHPSYECTVQPAKELIDESNPAKYRPFTYLEFLGAYVGADVDSEKTTKHFKLIHT